MKIKKEYIVLKKYSSNKWFGLLLLIMGLIGLAFILHQVLSFNSLLAPNMDYLYPDYITNNVSGPNYLAYFTIISNLLISIYFIALALSIFGIKGFKWLVYNPTLVGAFVLYIFIVGTVYCFILAPFIKDLPWTGKFAIINYISLWQHVIVPLFGLVLLFRPFTNRTISKNCAYYYLIFPFIYLIFSLIRGAITNFYAYPFFNAKLLWNYLGGGKPYNQPLAILYMILVLTLILIISYLFGLFIIKTHNRKVKLEFEKTFEHKIIPDKDTKEIYLEEITEIKSKE